MSLPASRARTVFRACVVSAVRDSEALMAALVAGASAALAAQESSERDIHKRSLIGDALRLLRQHESTLIQAYPMAFLEICAEGPSAANSRPGQSSGMDIGELALMDDSDVLAQVELSRAQQLVAHATEATLAELDALVSSAQGLHSVQPESNPLRPENYIRALQQVVGDTGVSGEVRQLWMSQMRELLGAQLVQAYQRAAQSLREHGVEPVGYAVAGAAGSRGFMSGGADLGSRPMGVGYPPSGYGVPVAYGSGYGAGWGGPSGSMELAPEAQEALLTVGILRQMLAGGGDPFAFDAPAGTYVPAEAAEAMQDIAQLERIVGRLAGAAQTSGQLPVPAPGWNGASASAAVSAAAPARAAQGVVSRMMENIAQDSRLLPPVQRAVQRLEPALKELVVHDTGFFSDEQHPARRLLDELTARSLVFTTEDGPAFSRFMRLVNEAVGHLASQEIKDAEPFAQVLRALQKAWMAQDRMQRERQQALHRERIAQKIATDFRRLPDADKVSPELMAFITGPWVDVVIQAQSSQPQDEGGDPGGYLAVVPLLICCAQPDQLRSDPVRLGQALADMLPVVVRGLESIGHSPEGIAQVMLRLQQIQQQAQDFAAAGVQEDSPTFAPVSEVPSDEAPDPQADAQEFMLPAADDAAADTAAAQCPPVAPQPELRIGQWVEIVSNQKAVRTQLTWCSPHHTLFLFTAADASTQSMTRRMIDKLIAEGSFRFISHPPEAGRAARTGRTRSGKLR